MYIIHQMKVNSRLVKSFFVVLFFVLALLVIFPIAILAATNYGDGNYGGGDYNVGDLPTPTPTAVSSNTGSDSTSPASAPQCNNSVTTSTPDLFEIHTTKNTATLYFAPPTMPYSNFYIAYSTKSDSWQYGTQYYQGFSSGVLSYTINALQPNTTYYFKIRPGNGCTPGNWGNTMTATTTSSTRTKTYYKNIGTAVVQKIKNFLSGLFPSKSINIPQPTNTAKPIDIQNLTQQPEPTVIPTPSPKPKFCILWWCF